MRTFKPTLITLVILASLSLAAQQPPPQPRPGEQPPVTFKVEINYVEIDAIVTDAEGNFVRGLTKDDFQVLEQGKPQTLSICSLIDIPLERAEMPLFAASPIEPDVRSNEREFNGRVFVLILDDLNTQVARSPRVKAAAKQFIERFLGANDIAAIVQTGGNTRGGQEFTNSRRLLLRAVDSFMGQKLRSATLEKIDDYFRQRDLGTGAAPRDMSEAERAHKARGTLSTLKSVADYMAGIRGRRKAVVFFSEGIDYDIYNTIENRYASDIRQEAQDAIAAATRANVSFYGIDPRGLGGLGDETMEITSLPDDNSLGVTNLQQELRLAQDSLRMISDETGGFAAVNQNDFRTAFSRIITDNSSYYVLGYYSNDERRDGRFRSVDVRTKRPGLHVRARKGYTAPKGRAVAKPAITEKASPALREALDSPVPISGLALKVFATPLKGPAPNASILVALEIAPGKLTFIEKGGMYLNDLEVGLVAIDASAKVRDAGRDDVNLRLQKTYEAVKGNGIRIMRRLEVPPGRYQLRIGVRETNGGALGSVLVDLDVPDFTKSDLTMAGLLLTSTAAGRTPTANPDPDFKEVLPAQPAALREFPRDDTLSLFTEVYDNETKTPHRVSIKSSVLAGDGRVLFTAGDERSSAELKGARGGYGYVAAIPLKDFAPGRYVLRVEATVLVANGAKAMRELEFTVR
jgi:VWFA-related protein